MCWLPEKLLFETCTVEMSGGSRLCKQFIQV